MDKYLVRAPGLDFAAALVHSEVLARQMLGDVMLLSWYDHERDVEAPGHVSECSSECGTPGWWDYAVSRGARLAIEFDGGRFTFCYLSLG